MFNKFFNKDNNLKIVDNKNNNNKKILIVDDASINRYIIKKYIEKINPNIVINETPNGLSAIAMQKENLYDIIFMDIKMPGIDGIETSRRILKDYPKVIIYGITGQVESNVMNEAKKAGLKKCIGKPIGRNDIEELINQAN